MEIIIKIIRIFGGTGNQMFQYALYLTLKEKNMDVKLHDCIAQDYGNIRKIFQLEWNEASRFEIAKLTDSSMKIWSRIRRKITGQRRVPYVQKDCNYDVTPFLDQENYLCGYWQCVQYVEPIRRQVLKAFDLNRVFWRYDNNDIKKDNLNFLEKIRSSCSVSIHVRRGDYVDNEENQNIYGNICTETYYEQAMSYFKNRYKRVVFFLFTNDITWTKKQKIFSANDCIIVDCNQELDYAIFDMMLMKNCSHNIIANSSFSWWGAYLNESFGKEVIAPRFWLNNQDACDIYCEGWILMDNKGKIY